MSSIIDQFNAKSNLNYSFLSSKYKTYGVPKDALSKDSEGFYTETSPYYWQISFSQPVTAKSYQICTCTSVYTYVSSWDVRYANETSFTFLQTDKISYATTNAVKYSFPKPITFKKLKITYRSTSNGGKWLLIGKFDLFGTVQAPVQSICRNRQRIVRNAIILIMQLTTCWKLSKQRCFE